MNHPPPFVANSDDDTHCVNAVYRMLFQYFCDIDFTWQDIDRMTRAEPGKGTWTVCGDIELAKRGIRVTNIEPVDYHVLYREGTDHLKRIFGPETYSYYMEKSNITSVLPDIPEFLRTVTHETRRATPEEIITLLTDSNLVAATVNASVLNTTAGFSLHEVLIWGYDGKRFFLHDPGLPPRPSRSVSPAEFESCFNYPGGNGGIDVFHE